MAKEEEEKAATMRRERKAREQIKGRRGICGGGMKEREGGG